MAVAYITLRHFAKKDPTFHLKHSLTYCIEDTPELLSTAVTSTSVSLLTYGLFKLNGCSKDTSQNAKTIASITTTCLKTAATPAPIQTLSSIAGSIVGMLAINVAGSGVINSVSNNIIKSSRKAANYANNIRLWARQKLSLPTQKIAPKINALDIRIINTTTR